MKKPLIVITGASSGIGEATAIKFSQEGYPLLLLARRLDRMEALALPDSLSRQVDITDLNGFRILCCECSQVIGIVILQTEKAIHKQFVLFSN